MLAAPVHELRRRSRTAVLERKKDRVCEHHAKAPAL